MRNEDFFTVVDEKDLLQLSNDILKFFKAGRDYLCRSFKYNSPTKSILKHYRVHLMLQ